MEAIVSSYKLVMEVRGIPLVYVVRQLKKEVHITCGYKA